MRRTTICCSALALIAAWSLSGSAQTTTPSSLRRVKQTHPDDRTPLSLFPLKTLATLALNSAIAAPPAYDATRGFFSIGGDRIAAYDLISGTRLWVVAASTRVEPATGDDLVFVVEPASIAALRASDGSRAWELPFADKVAVPPAWDNGWLVVASAAGQVLTLRATDGEILWRRDLGAPLHGRPAFAGDRMYLPMSDSRVVALRIETGAPVWERRLGGAANDITALNDRIYLGSQDKYMYCLNAEDGEVEWRWLTGGPVIGQPVVDERTVYFVSLDNVLRALNRSSGVQRWKRALPVRPVSGPLRAVDALVVTGVSPVLRGYKLEDGKPAGELAIAGEVVAPPRLFTTPSRSLPILIAVTRDIAKGSTVVALTRSVEPAVTVMTPLPNLIVMTPPPTTPPPVRP